MSLHQLLVTATRVIPRDQWDDDGDDDGDTQNQNCVTAVPGKYGNVPIDACNSYYNYNPQFAPAVAVAAIFGIFTLVHIVEGFAFRKRFTWVVIMGAAWETVAFVLHALGSHDQQQIAYATAWNILFLLAPLWINAFVYMTFARMVYFFLPDGKVGPIHATSIAKWFVWFDVFTFIVQAVGASMASPGAGSDTVKTGINVYMAGMGIQQFFIVVFLGLMVTFHVRSNGTSGYMYSGEGEKKEWKALLFSLYGVLTCITVRLIYRIAEFAGGITPSNPVPFHEEYSYVLDCFPMMIALLVLAVWHPGRYLVGPNSEFPRQSRREKKAAKAEKKAAKKQAKEDRKQAKKEGREYSTGQGSAAPTEEYEVGQYGSHMQYTNQYGNQYGNQQGNYR